MIQNSTLKTIFERRSVRKFKSKKISLEAIKTIVRAGQRAPTACRMETYSFILISDNEKRKQIIQKTVSHGPTREFMEEAPIWILICTDFARQIKFLEIQNIKNDFNETSKFMLGIIDAALAAENMVLAAESIGLGSCFVGSIWTAPKLLAEILSLPKNVLPLVLLCIGHPNENPSPRPRWPLKVILHENEYRMPDDESMEEYQTTRENWNVNYPYKLPRELEQKIRKEWIELGFNI